MATYAVADLHGRYDLWEKIKEFLKPEDTLYVLGDCSDRGPRGWDIIVEVMEHPQTIYLKGNHEDMLVDAMEGDEYLAYVNGGGQTLSDWEAKTMADMRWVKRLNALPTKAVYTNKDGKEIILCHAGYSPGWCETPTDRILLWERHQFKRPWDMSYPDTYMIHGHTPIPYMRDYTTVAPREEDVEPGVFWYCKSKDGINHKCNIDCGAFFTGCTALLDLDTFAQHIFMAKDCIYNKKD